MLVGEHRFRDPITRKKRNSRREKKNALAAVGPQAAEGEMGCGLHLMSAYRTEEKESFVSTRKGDLNVNADGM